MVSRERNASRRVDTDSNFHRRRNAYNRAFLRSEGLRPRDHFFGEKNASSDADLEDPHNRWYIGESQYLPGFDLSARSAAKGAITFGMAALFLYACTSPANLDPSATQTGIDASGKTKVIDYRYRKNRSAVSRRSSRALARRTAAGKLPRGKLDTSGALLFPEVDGAPRAMILRYRVGRNLERAGYKIRFNPTLKHAVRVQGKYHIDGVGDQGDRVVWSFYSPRGDLLLEVHQKIRLPRLLSTRKDLFFSQRVAQQSASVLLAAIRGSFGNIAFLRPTEGNRKDASTAVAQKTKPVRRGRQVDARRVDGARGSGDIYASNSNGDPRDGLAFAKPSAAPKKPDDLNRLATASRPGPAKDEKKVDDDPSSTRPLSESRRTVANERENQRRETPTERVAAIEAFRRANAFFNGKVNSGAATEITWSNQRILLRRGAGTDHANGRRLSDVMARNVLKFWAPSIAKSSTNFVVLKKSNASRSVARKPYYVIYVRSFRSSRDAIKYSVIYMKGLYFSKLANKVLAIRTDTRKSNLDLYSGPFYDRARAERACVARWGRGSRQADCKFGRGGLIQKIKLHQAF